MRVAEESCRPKERPAILLAIYMICWKHGCTYVILACHCCFRGSFSLRHCSSLVAYNSVCFSAAEAVAAAIDCCMLHCNCRCSPRVATGCHCFFRTVVPVCTELVTRLVVPKRSVHSPTGPSKPRELRPRPLHMRIRPLHMRAQGRVWVFPKTPAKSQFDTLTNWQCRISIAPDRTVTRQSDQCVACLEDRPKTEMSGTGRYTPPNGINIKTIPSICIY